MIHELTIDALQISCVHGFKQRKWLQIEKLNLVFHAFPSLCSIPPNKSSWFEGVFIERGLKTRILKLNQARATRKRCI